MFLRAADDGGFPGGPRGAPPLLPFDRSCWRPRPAMRTPRQVLLKKLTLLRKKDTPPREFRTLMKEITFYLGYEVAGTPPLPLRRVVWGGCCAQWRRLAIRHDRAQPSVVYESGMVVHQEWRPFLPRRRVPKN